MEKILLFIIVFAAALMDLAKSKISNELIVAGLTLGLMHSAISGGLEGILISLEGLAVPVLFLFAFFVMRLLGAGDLKLLSVVGAFTNPHTVLYCIAISIMFAGVISIIKILICKKRGRKLAIRFALPVFFSTLMYIGGLY